MDERAAVCGRKGACVASCLRGTVEAMPDHDRKINRAWRYVYREARPSPIHGDGARWACLEWHILVAEYRKKYAARSYEFDVTRRSPDLGGFQTRTRTFKQKHVAFQWARTIATFGAPAPIGPAGEPVAKHLFQEIPMDEYRELSRNFFWLEV